MITPPRKRGTPDEQPAPQPVEPAADKPRDPLVIGRCLATLRALRAARNSLQQAALSAADDPVLQRDVTKLRGQLAPLVKRAERVLEHNGGTQQLTLGGGL